MNRMLLRVALPLLALGMVTCRSAPPAHFYLITRLDATSLPEESTDQGVQLGVPPFNVDSPYDGDQLVYRVGQESPEIAYYTYHRWAAPLRDQLPLAVIAAFGDLPGVASIAPVGVGRRHDAALVGRLLYLEELDLPGEQIARIGLELALVDRSDRQIWRRRVAAQAGGLAGEVPEIVTYMRQALEEALRQVRPGLQAAVARMSD